MALPRTARRRAGQRIVADRAVFDECHGSEALAKLHDAFLRTTVCGLEDLPRYLDLDPADIEFVLRQVCYGSISRREQFNRRLISAVAMGRPVVAGLPPRWRAALREQGFTVAGRRSAIRWGAQATLNLGHGIAKYLMHILRMMQPSERRRANGAAGPTAYLHAIAAENLPIGLPDLPATDVVSWLEQHTDLLEGIDTVASRVEAPVSLTRGGRAAVGAAHPLAVPTGSRATLQFLWTGGAILVKALWRLLRGEWSSAMLAAMLVDAALLRSTQGHGQAAIHLFNTSTFAKRPLWTLIAPQFGMRSLCYHYSTNSESILGHSGTADEDLADSWRLCWWDEQFVWDSRQAAFLSGAAERPSKARAVGPVSFVATTRHLPAEANGALAVFDVTPVSVTRRATRVNDVYYTRELVEAFILDLAEAASSHGLVVAWKTKRKVEDVHDSAYRPFRERMKDYPGAVIVNPRVSAQQLIAASFAAVSIPFTSTALIAHAAGKPSTFYDPSGAVRPDHPAGRGLPMLSSKDALLAWLSSIVSNGAGQSSSARFEPS